MATPKKVAYHTLGCKLNFSETDSLRNQFEGAGFLTVDFEKDPADIVVINTCSVTDFADRKCRKAIRTAKKNSPDAKVIMTGCYAQLKPKEIAALDDVDLVLGAAEKFKILEYVEQFAHCFDETRVEVGAVTDINNFEQAFSFGSRTRSFLKVQDGCDYKCSFCTIPQARGASRSDTVENVINNAQKLASQGVQEIVLTGVNIGDFGLYPQDGKERVGSFLSLIQALDQVVGIERFRISSIEPNLCHNEIIEFVAKSEKFVPHFHMPLQSGSDKILRMMKRRYVSELYRDRVETIKQLMPHCCIGVDVIVGFPGETNEDFLETFNFLEELDISYLHVFTYSERNNTLAASMEDAVDMNTRRKRNEMLRNLSERKKLAFYKKHSGIESKVLFENSKVEGLMTGFTNNYIKITTPLAESMINTIQSVNLLDVNPKGLMECTIAI